MKKVFIISSILLVVVLIFLGIYNFAFNDTTKTSQKKDTTQKQIAEKQQNAAVVKETGSETVKTPQKSVTPKDERIIPVSKRRVVSPTIDQSKEKIRFYDKDTGEVIEVPIIGGNERLFSDVRLPGFVYAAWAPDAQRVLTKFVDKHGVRIYFFDHRTSRGTQLKRGIDRVEWAITGDQILYTFFDNGTRRTTLNIADADGKNWRILAEDIAKGTRFVNVQQSSRIALWRSPNAYEKTDLKVVSLLDTKPKPKTIFSGHYNADFLFSPNGERILISSTQTRGSNARMLGIANADGGEYLNLRIPTNVNKCAWATNSRTIYCAFPTGDRDTFWKIDVTTNKKERILDLDNVIGSSTRYQAFDLFLAPDGQALFFINAIDGRLYRIAL